VCLQHTGSVSGRTETLYFRRIKEKLPNNIETILIDLDGVLVPEGSDDALRATSELVPPSLEIDAETFREVARNHIQELWSNSPFLPYAKSLGISSTEALCLQQYNGDNEQMRSFYEWTKQYQQEVWQNVLANFNITNPELTTAFVNKFQREKRVSYKAYSGVHEVLTKLKERYKLCIITNGAPDLQRLKIAEANLGQYFGDNIIVSGEVGIGKPDPQIFQMALEKLGTTAQTAVMIGDNLESDIQGAERANIVGITISRPKMSKKP